MLPAVTAAAPAPPVNHFELAVQHQATGNFEMAMKHYLAVLEADEFNVEARNNLGMLYAGRGLTLDAVDHLRRAIRISPDYLNARGNLAVVLMNAGRLAEAQAEIRDALRLDPKHVGLLVNQALIQMADRQPELARETLIRAIGYEPRHAEANYNLAILYDEAGSLAKAHEHYDRFLANAGSEYGERLEDVRRRIEAIAPELSR
jgi:tetratricopeptide (TPR) repeat protein